MKKWTVDSIPDQTGRTAIVTGANSGIGFETAKALAGKGAHVVLACRNQQRGDDAVDRIRQEAGAGTVEMRKLDLSDLSSVATFSANILDVLPQVDLLIANAGVMMPKKRTETKDGFELQLGTNHLGHFALVGKLLPLLEKQENSRVVVVSSLAHRGGKINFADLQWQKRRYLRMPSYAQSKLANLLFAQELDRRLSKSGSKTIAVAAHPGWTSTNLQKESPFIRFLNPMFGMPCAQGALPSLYAATDSDVEGGDYYGPGGLFEVRGWPKKAKVSKRASNLQTAHRLWEVSQDLTGISYL